MKRQLTVVLVLLAVLAVAPVAAAGIWNAYEGVKIAQNDPRWAEVLPAEGMDPSHTITWYQDPGAAPSPVGGVRFFSSYTWNDPVPGDTICWLDDSLTRVIWWEGVFNRPSTSVYIQFDNCDYNDGWADIYVDDALEYSYWSRHATGTNVLLVGTDLDHAAHTVRIQTRAANNDGGLGDVSIDYVAIVPEPAALGLIGLAALVVRRRRN